MRIAFVVNDILTELDDYTTTLLALTATNTGHEVWYINVGDFALRPDNRGYAHAYSIPDERHRSPHVYLQRLRSKDAQKKEICLDELDVLLLRNDPSQDAISRPWARMAAINFSLLAEQHGVIVLNDPSALALTLTKLYMHYFPSQVSPRTLVTRNMEEARAFIDSEGGHAVIKPLFGSGGHNVFLIRPQDNVNINQMLEAVSSEGYVIVQEYLPDAIHGDTRLFLLNGEPLRCQGKIAAIHRMRCSGDADMRSNLTSGAVARKAVINDGMLRLAELVRPRLVQDGIFFAGLDIIGDKIMEINVLSPGGIHSAEALEHAPFAKKMIESIEAKLDYQKKNPGKLSNRELAVKAC